MPAASIVIIEEEAAPLAQMLTIGNAEYINVDMQKQTALKKDLLQKYYGVNSNMLLHMRKNIGFSLDMTTVSTIANEIELGCDVTEIAAFANGFKTLKLTPAKAAKLPYALGMHVHVGEEYEGKFAYVFTKDALTGAYSRQGVLAVNEIGNIGFYLAEMTEIMILIAE